MFNTPQSHSFVRSRAWLCQMTLLMVAIAAVQAQTPLMHIVGIHADSPSETGPDKRWFEAVHPASLILQNLYTAQRSTIKDPS
jgi:hypothetical protein